MRVLASVLVGSSVRLAWVVRFMLGLSFCSAFYLLLVSDKPLLKVVFCVVLVFVFILLILSFFIRLSLFRPYRLEISDSGEILMRFLDSHDGSACIGARMRDFVIVWSQLIILRLRTEFGVYQYVVIFWDSVGDDSFRKLTVAVNYCAQRGAGSVNTVNNLSDGNF
jgi:hypothetical protein